MHLVLLGTAGYHPNDSRHTPCILLPECGIMLDAGTGVYRAGKYLQTPELDIFLTHAHLDHVIGLTYLFDLLHEHPLRRVTVHGVPDKLAAVEEHLFSPLLFPKKPPFDVRPLADAVVLPQGETRGQSHIRPRRFASMPENRDSPQGGRLTHFPLQHPGGVLGLRLDWPGHSLAYVTDTTAAVDAAYVEKIRGVNLLLHECYFPDGNEESAWALKTGHSCTTPVAEVAARAGVGRLVLMHINPLATADDPVGLAAARSIFPRTEVGVDLMELEF